MVFDDVMALLNYWRKHPPLRDLVAGFIGYKPPPEKSSDDDKPRAPTAAEIKMLYPDGYIR